MSEAVVVELCEECAPLLQTCDTIARVRLKACDGCRARIQWQVAKKRWFPEESPEGKIIPFRTARGGGRRRP